MLTFRYRKDLPKKEINEALQRVDEYLGQTLFVESARIRPDGGLKYRTMKEIGVLC